MTAVTLGSPHLALLPVPKLRELAARHQDNADVARIRATLAGDQRPAERDTWDRRATQHQAFADQLTARADRYAALAPIHQEPTP